jgi:hypothetical protein
MGSSIVTVDVVEHRSERGRLAGTGRAGDEHEATALLGESRDTGGQAELDEVGDLARDDPERERRRAALPEPVDAEARQRGMGERDIEVARIVEEVATLRRDLGHLVEHVLEIALGESGRSFHLLEIPVMAEHRRLSELEVNVARAALDGAREKVDEVDHDENIGRRGRHLYPTWLRSGGRLQSGVGIGPAATRVAQRVRSAAAADGQSPSPRQGGRRRP